MEKKTSYAFGKTIYLLGEDKDGVKYWLEQGSWDCDWYWGFGYIETYTNNKNPSRSKDISSHEHFDSKILNAGTYCFDTFKEIFVKTPLNDKEIWTLCELMKTFYTLEKTSELYYKGSSHITNNPSKDLLKNDEEYQRINKILIPNIMEEVYKILED